MSYLGELIKIENILKYMFIITKMYKGKRIFPKMVSTKIFPHYQKLASQDKVLFKTAEPIVGYITQTFLKFSQVHSLWTQFLIKLSLKASLISSILNTI